MTAAQRRLGDRCTTCGWKTTTTCADVDLDDQAPVDECGGGDYPKEARPWA